MEYVHESKIRFRISLTVSLLSRILWSSIIRLLMVFPISFSHEIEWNWNFWDTYNNHEVDVDVHLGTDVGVGEDSQQDDMLFPYQPQPPPSYLEHTLNTVQEMTILILIYLVLSQVYTFWKTARIGIYNHLKLFVFCSFPYWMLLISTLVWNSKLEQQHSTSFSFIHNANPSPSPIISRSWWSCWWWWECIIPNLFCSIGFIIHFYCIEVWWGYLSILLSIPCIVFEIMMASFSNQFGGQFFGELKDLGVEDDGVETVVGVTKSIMSFLFCPLQIFAFLVLFIRCFIPCLRTNPEF